MDEIRVGKRNLYASNLHQDGSGWILGVGRRGNLKMGSLSTNKND